MMPRLVESPTNKICRKEKKVESFINCPGSSPPPPTPLTSEHLGEELIHGTAKSNFFNKTVDFVGDTSGSVNTTTNDNF